MIYKEYSIDCDDCYYCEVLYVNTVKAAETEARKLGWKKRKNQEWICKFCYQIKHNKTEKL